MTEPKFRLGALVRLVPSGVSTSAAERFFDALGSHTTPHGIFEVMAVLPERDGLRQYRIMGGEPRHERMVGESQLVHAGKPQA